MNLVVRKLERIDAGLGDQPRAWTLVWFEAQDDDRDRLASALSDALEATGGWYADFHSDSDVTVVFAGVASFVTGGATPAERAKVVEYARSAGVPEQQGSIGPSNGSHRRSAGVRGRCQRPPR